MSFIARKRKKPDAGTAATTTAGFVDELRRLAGELDAIADGLAEVHGVEPSTIDTHEQETDR